MPFQGICSGVWGSGGLSKIKVFKCTRVICIEVKELQVGLRGEIEREK